MLSLFRSAPRGPRTPRFFPEPDDTYASLVNLLRAPAASSSHLTLLEPATLYGSIAHYLSTLPLEHVPEFAKTIVESQCLWDVQDVLPTSVPRQGVPAPASSSTPKGKDAGIKNTPPAPVTLLDRAQNIADAVAGATMKRAELIVAYRKDDLGWQSRRLLSKWINAVTAATRSEGGSDAPPTVVQNGGVASLPATHATRIIRLSILSGILAGLQATRAKKRQNAGFGLSVRYHERAAEDEWIVAFAEGLEEPTRLYGLADDDTSVDEQGWEREFRQTVTLRTSNLSKEEVDPSSLEDAQARLSASVPLFLASKVMPYITDSKLSALPADALIVCFSDMVFALLDFGVVLRTLANDTVVDADGIVSLEANTGTAKRAAAALDTPLFAQIPLLSRVLSNAIARAVSSLSPLDAGKLLLGSDAASHFKATAPTSEPNQGRESRRPVMERCTQKTLQLKQAWISSALAGVEQEQIAEKSRSTTEDLWTLYKTFLFSQTMIYDTLIEAVVDMCPSPTITLRAPAEHTPGATSQEHSRLWPPSSTSNLPRPYVSLTSCVLRNFGHLFWMTSTFGTSPNGGPRGFETYRRAFYSSLDVLSRDGEASVSLLEDVAPESMRAAMADGHRHAFSTAYAVESNSAKRSDATYFLDVSEQLVSVMPDEMVELVLLPVCRAYLGTAEYVNTYESAHSAVLAVFGAQKRIVPELSPYYLLLLLQSYPSRMSLQHLEVAVSTVVSSASDHDDAAAWWCLVQIQERIEADRLAALGISGSSGTGGDVTGKDKETPQLSSLSSTSSALPAPGAAAASPTDVPEAPTAESSHAGSATGPAAPPSLAHIYVAQLPCLNLVLLRSALDYTRTLILRAPPASAERTALCERTFAALGGLNASTREEGLRWWLDRRAEFGV